jgi:pimeloyl-ACP methyl ester carboxylesterase
VLPRGRVYLFRGALGLIFSRGMDKLAKRIEEAGVAVDVNEFTVCSLVAERAIREYREDPAPITLIGHSMGGFCSLQFAEKLQAENIPVSLIVTIDPAHLMPKLPMNVERYMNIFLARDVLGGGDVIPEKDFQGHYASFDLSKLKGVLHINIDKMDIIHAQLLTKILQIPETPAKLEGEAVPIRYVVPPDASVELWDSGIPALVRAGDTLETLAVKYRVPLWALTQINQIPEGAALVSNQRVIVPRHLTPVAAVTGQSTSKR